MSQWKYNLLIALGLLLCAQPAIAQDSDGDGLSDADETNIYQTDPSNVDSDNDGLTDGEEVLNFNTKPNVLDSDGGGLSDRVELILGTDPNTMSDDDPAASPVGNGPWGTWIRGGMTVNTLLLATALLNLADPFESRGFALSGPINFANQPQPGPYGPFANHVALQDIWGTDQNNFAVAFSGLLYVPPATATNPNNVFTFAVSSDEGVALEVFDGLSTQRVEFEGARAIDTSLLTVDFPAIGGLYPITLLTHDSDADATFGIKLSWAPNQQMAFNANAFSLISPSQLISPELTSTQSLKDVNEGSVEIGDFLELSVTLTNTGKSAAYDVRFSPSVLIGARFDQYTVTPERATVSTQAGRPIVQFPVIGQGESVTLAYQIIVEQNNIVSQGQWFAQTSPGQGLLRIVTDDPAQVTNTADTGNQPAALSMQGTTDDDANGATVGQDLLPPTLTIDRPANNDTLTNNTPLFFGQTEANAMVVLTIDANAPVNITADVTGFWSHAASTLTPGNHNVSAIATDAAGNTSPTVTATFTVQNVPFGVVPATPVVGSHINTAQPTYTGTTTPGAQVIIETYDAMDVLQTTGTVTADANGLYNFTSPFTLNEGLQRVEIRATSGGQTVTATYPFTVDVFPPAIIFTLPSQMQTIAQSQPTLYGTTDPYAEVTISVDMGMTQTVRANAQGQWQWTSPMTLIDGIHRARAEAVDLAGNQGLFANLTFSIDSTPPTLDVVFPAQNQQVANGNVTIRGTTEPNATVRLSIDGAPDVIVQAGQAGTWSYVVNPALMDGPHQVVAQATDAVGNTSPTVTRDFIVNTSMPMVEITAPQENEVTGPRPIITGTAEVGNTVELRIDNGQRFEVPLDANGQWMHQPTSDLTHGAHAVRAFATNGAGISVNDTVNFLVDARAPTLDITSPKNNEDIPDKTPTVTGKSDANTEVEIYVNGQFVGTTTTDANGDWSFDIPEANALSTGQNTIEARAEDDLGNKTSDSVNVNLDVALALIITSPADNAIVRPTFTVKGTGRPELEVSVRIDGQQIGTTMSNSDGDWTFDITDPLRAGDYRLSAKQQELEDQVNITVRSPGTLTIDEPTDGSGVTDDTPTIKGTAAPGVEVTICIDGKEVGKTTADAQGRWSFDVPPEHALKEGENTIEAKATDTFGDPITSAPVKVTYTTEDWTLSVDKPVANAEISTTPTISGTAKPGATVDVFVDGKKIGTTTADDNGDWSLTPDMPLEPGQRTITVTGTDGTLEKQSGDIPVTILDGDPNDLSGFRVQGGPACHQAPTTPPGQMSLLLLFGMIIGVVLRRREA